MPKLIVSKIAWAGLGTGLPTSVEILQRDFPTDLDEIARFGIPELLEDAVKAWLKSSYDAGVFEFNLEISASSPA